MKLDENSFSRNSFISLPPSDDSLLTTADFLQRPFPRQLSNDRDVDFQSRGRNPSRSLAADPQPESRRDVRSSFYQSNRVHTNVHVVTILERGLPSQKLPESGIVV